MSIDCEAIGQGLLAQPANAVSALAFVGLAAYVSRRSPVLAVAGLMVAIGSFSYHAQPGPITGWLDGWGVAVLGWALIVVATGLGPPSRAGRIEESPSPRNAGALRLAGRWPVMLVLGIVVIPEVMRSVAAGVLGLGAVVAAVRRLPTESVIAAGAIGLPAVVLYVLGRTGGPLCAPESLIQPHAIWHVAMAIVVTVVASGLEDSAGA